MLHEERTEVSCDCDSPEGESVKSRRANRVSSRVCQRPYTVANDPKGKGKLGDEDKFELEDTFAVPREAHPQGEPGPSRNCTAAVMYSN